MEGLLNETRVEVLRDSGCSTVIAKKDLIRKEQFTGQVKYCLLIDRSVRKFPVANVFVDTPFYAGEVEVLVVENPLYDLILGNVSNVRDASDPKPDWKPSKEEGLAVQTRQQRRQADKPLRKLIVPDKSMVCRRNSFAENRKWIRH